MSVKSVTTSIAISNVAITIMYILVNLVNFFNKIEISEEQYKKGNVTCNL